MYAIPIDVFLRDDCLCDLSLAFWCDMFAQGELYQDTGNFLIVVESLDHVDDFFHRSFSRQRDVSKFNPNFFCCLGFHANISRRVGTAEWV